jgi:hypothetical protein
VTNNLMQTGTASSFRSVLMFGDTDLTPVLVGVCECRILTGFRRERNCFLEAAEIPIHGFLR